MELLDALFKMEHGGDPNALLQVSYTLECAFIKSGSISTAVHFEVVL